MAGRDFGADLFSATEPSTAPATAGQDFGADLFGKPAPTATAAPATDTAGQDFGSALFGASASKPVDTLDAKLAAQEAKRAQFAPGEEFVKGVKSAATVSLPSLWENAGVMKDVGAALTVKQRMDLFDKIDKGEITSNDQLRGLDMTTGQGRMYLAASPETRQMLRGRLDKELASRKDLVNASIETLKAYQEDAKKYKPRVEKATDIGSAADFTNWLANNVGAGAVNLAPIMLTAAATGGVGLLGMGAAMGTAEATGNRMEALQKQLSSVPPEQRADLVMKRLEETGGVNLAVGIASGALDTVLGPAATLVKQLAKKVATGEVLKQGRKEAAKAAAKQIPKSMAEEGLTGGLQEAAQIAGKVRVGERDEFATKETAKDIFNAAMAEAAGAPAGGVVNTAVAALQAGKAEPTEETKTEKPVATEKETLVAKYRGMGMMQDDAEKLADRIIAEKAAKEKADAEAAASAAAYEKELKDRELADREAEAAAAAAAKPTLESLTGEFIDQGLTEEEARVQAQLVLDREKPIVTEPPKPASTIREREPAPTLESLTAEFIDQGLTEDEARVQAQLYLDRSKSAPAKGESNVARPNAEPSGVGAGVAGQPNTELTTGGAGVTQRNGMVPAGQNAGNAAEGEGAQPRALTPYEEGKKAAEDRPSIDAYSSPYKEETPEHQQWMEGVLDVKYPSTKPAETTEADYQQRKAKAVDFAKRSFFVAKDAQGEFDSLQDAIDAHRENVIDTLNDEGETERGVIDAALNAFDAEVSKLKEEPANGAETTETVQTEEKGQKAPATRRGRPTVLSEEDKAKREQERKEDRAARGRHERAVNKAEAALQKALEPLDEGEYENEAALKEAQDDQRAERRNAVKELLKVSEESGLKPEGKRARKILKDANISQTEIDDIKRGLERTKKALADKTNLLGPMSSAKPRRGAKVVPADAAFSKFTTGQQAINYIIRKGNIFQKLLGMRLRNALRGVEFVVLEEGDEIPAQLQTKRNADAWERSRGLFIQNFNTGRRVVYVRGASFGNSQGANIVTVLHELLHAATALKIEQAAQFVKAGTNLNTPLVQAYMDLVNTMHNAQEEFYNLNDANAIPPELADLLKSTDLSIITDPNEFLAYGMSDEDFQEFLMTAEGEEQQPSLFTQFVKAIAKVFGMPPGFDNAMIDLVIATDALISAKIPKTKQAETGAEGVFAQNQKQAKKITATERKLQRSRDAQSTIDDIGVLTTLRDPQLFLDTLGAMWKSLNTKKLQALLPAIQTNTLVEWAENLGIAELGRTWRMSQDMSAMRTKLLAASSDVVQEWLKIQPGMVGKLVGKLRSKKDELTALADVMHYSTDKAIDPTKSTKDPVLNKMWDALSPQAKKVYEQVRDFYQSQYDLYRTLLDERIANSSIPGEVNDPDTPKGQLMSEIKKAYETGKGLAPYFPLMRYGQYWVRVGNGKSKEFYMFESEIARELFLKRRVRELQKAGDTRTESQMKEDMDLDTGNSLEGLRKSSIESSTMLKNIFEILDEPGATQDVEALKDQVYQLYLTTMPEQNFRRQFIHRKGTTGYSGDALRNFITSSVNMANQLARIKYGPQMINSVETAQDSLEGNPDKERLEMLVKEMGERIKLDVYPSVESPFLNAAANVANKSAFIYFMTSVKTAVVQLSSLPVFGAPVLFSRHNPVQVVKEMSRFMLVFNQFGVVKDGKLVMPTIEASKEVNLNADERAAIEAMHDRGIAEVTMTYDLMDRKKTPSAKYSGAWNTTTRLMGGLFHHVERINREIMFLTSFRLSMNEGKSREEAIEQAVSDTHAALGNFTAQNRPRTMRGPVGRTLLQFKMFPAFLTTYLIRNAYRATAGMDAATKKEARIQLIGTLMMSATLAGYVGVPGISMAIGAMQAVINMLRGEDEDDPLEKRDLENWFRQVYLPDFFGDVKIGDRKLGEVLDTGMLDSITGYDMSNSMSMNNIWFPELKEQKTAQATMMDYAMSLLGPSASLFFKQIPGAYDDFAAGRFLQGFEKLLPALFKNPVTAYRYGTEGARTATGAVLKHADEFTKGQLIMQALGFRTEGLAAVQEANFKAEALRQKVIQEKAAVRTRLDRELELGSDEAVDKAMDKLLDFNYRNPQSAIKPSDLPKQLLNRAKERAQSDRGFKVDKAMYPYLAELLDLSREKIEREAAK